jgi:hypothetical protein
VVIEEINSGGVLNLGWHSKESAGFEAINYPPEVPVLIPAVTSDSLECSWLNSI